MTYTAAQKKEYYRKLRENWDEAKKTANVDQITAIIRTHGLNISVFGFAFVQRQMEAQGLDGLPYLDMKTFQGWKENGFKVAKGQHATADGLTWVQVGAKVENEEVTDNAYKMPRSYKLFHRSQVQEV